MARQFNGTDQSLQSASAINLSAFTKLSISVWFYSDGFANDNDLMMELSPVSSNPGTFAINPNESSGVFQAEVRGDTAGNRSQFSRPSATAWHHYAFHFDFTEAVNEVPIIWVDGVSQSLTPSGTDNAGTFANDVLNFMSRNNAGLFYAGRLAEVAIYGGVLLTQGQVDSLQTTKPHLVGSATFGWHLDGTTSPEPNFVGGVDLTVNGATFVDHPPALSTDKTWLRHAR